MIVTDPKGSLLVTIEHIFHTSQCREVPVSVNNDPLVNGTIEFVFDETRSCVYAYRVLLFEFFIQNKLDCHYGNLRVLRYKSYRYRNDVP